MCRLSELHKNPLVVLDDADLKVAVEIAVNGAFFSTGQRCTASSRLIVQAGIRSFGKRHSRAREEWPGRRVFRRGHNSIT